METNKMPIDSSQMNGIHEGADSPQPGMGLYYGDPRMQQTGNQYYQNSNEQYIPNDPYSQNSSQQHLENSVPMYKQDQGNLIVQHISAVNQQNNVDPSMQGYPRTTQQQTHSTSSPTLNKLLTSPSPLNRMPNNSYGNDYVGHYNYRGQWSSGPNIKHYGRVAVADGEIGNHIVQKRPYPPNYPGYPQYSTYSARNMTNQTDPQGYQPNYSQQYQRPSVYPETNHHAGYPAYPNYSNSQHRMQVYNTKGFSNNQPQESYASQDSDFPINSTSYPPNTVVPMNYRGYSPHKPSSGSQYGGPINSPMGHPRDPQLSHSNHSEVKLLSNSNDKDMGVNSVENKNSMGDGDKQKWSSDNSMNYNDESNCQVTQNKMNSISYGVGANNHRTTTNAAAAAAAAAAVAAAANTQQITRPPMMVNSHWKSENGRVTPNGSINEMVKSSPMPSPSGTSIASTQEDIDPMSPGMMRLSASPFHRTSITPVKSGRGATMEPLEKLMNLGSEEERPTFLHRLFTFMEDIGQPIAKVPVISNQILDLFKLYMLVKDRGGMTEVHKQKVWRDIAVAMDLTSSKASFAIRKNYIKCLFHFECKFDRGGIDPAPIISSMETNRGRKSKNTNNVTSANSDGFYGPFEMRPPPGNAPVNLQDPFSNDDCYYNQPPAHDHQQFPLQSMVSQEKVVSSQPPPSGYWNDCSPNSEWVQPQQMFPPRKPHPQYYENHVPNSYPVQRFPQRLPPPPSYQQKPPEFQPSYNNSVVRSTDTPPQQNGPQFPPTAQCNWRPRSQFSSQPNRIMTGTPPSMDYRQRHYMPMMDVFPLGSLIKKEVHVFPPKSVEAEQPLLVKRKRLMAKDIGNVSKWRLLMALKSGLLAECTWAIDALNVLLFDDHSVDKFQLSTMPGILNALIEHWRQSLEFVFPGTFDDIPKHSCESFTDVPVTGPSVFEIANDVFQCNNDKLLSLESPAQLANPSDDNPWLNQKAPKEDSCCVGCNGGHYVVDYADSLTPRSHRIVKFECKAEIRPWMIPQTTENHNNGAGTSDIVDPLCHTDNDQESKANADVLTQRLQGSNRPDDTPIPDHADYPTNCFNKDTDLIRAETKSDPMAYVVKPDHAHGDNDAPDNIKRQIEEITSRRRKRHLLEKNSHLHLFYQHDSDENRIPSLIEYESEEMTNSTLVDLDEKTRQNVCKLVAISNIFRGLSCIPGNDRDLSQSTELVSFITRIMILGHRHANVLEDEVFPLMESIFVTSTNSWLQHCLDSIRENCIVLLTNICGRMDLTMYTDALILPLLECLIHWALCPSSYAIDPLSSSSNPTITLQRLAIETLAKMSIHEANADFILATKPFHRLESLFECLVTHISERRCAALRELSIVLLSEMACGSCAAAHSIGQHKSAVSQLIGYIEDGEAVYSLDEKRLSKQDREQMESLEPNIGMLLRTVRCLRHIAVVKDNHNCILQHKDRLLALATSNILPHPVVGSLGSVLYELQLTS